jgi:hypothetical protein
MLMPTERNGIRSACVSPLLFQPVSRSIRISGYADVH